MNQIRKNAIFAPANYAYLFLPFVFFSCTNKKYKYVEVQEITSAISGKHIKETEAEPISAVSDSAAYLGAYRIFILSKKVRGEIAEKLKTEFNTPKSFKLYNDKNEDITGTTMFQNKDVLEKEIQTEIAAIKSTMDDTNSPAESARPKLDASKIKSLGKFFRKKTDEFSSEGTVWHIPLSAPKYTNRNGLYCYFQTNNGMASNLRFQLQYYAEEWLFFEGVKFSIDGKAFDYIPRKTETDSGDGGHIWEWFDEPVTSSDKGLINALANAKSAKMKLIGRQYFKIKSITSTQLADIKRAVDLYQAMGGKI